MYNKKIKYTDFLGKEREEEFQFNLTKAETVEWLATSGDYTLDKVLLKLVRSDNSRDVVSIVKDLILRSYGEISLDGRLFDKSEEVKKRFEYSEAYSTLFTELMTDERALADFINAILPADFSKEIATIVAQNPEGIPDDLKAYAEAAKKANEETASAIHPV